MAEHEDDAVGLWLADPYTKTRAAAAAGLSKQALRNLIQLAEQSTDPDIVRAWARYDRIQHVIAHLTERRPEKPTEGKKGP